MALKSVLYNCNYTSNLYSKRKTWHSGMLKACRNHGSTTLSLYESNERSDLCGRLIDTFDIFDAKSDSLSGREFTTTRNIIDVLNVHGNEEPRPAAAAFPKSKVRTGLPRLCSAPYRKEGKGDSYGTQTPELKDRLEVVKSSESEPAEALLTLNVHEIVSNMELLFEDE